MSTTILYADAPFDTDAARADGDRVWLTPADLEAATGWALKPEGLCRDEACIPLPADGSWQDADDRVELTALAAHLGRPVVADTDRSAWAVGASASARGEELLAGRAPDFALPDLDGTVHRLSDYRGKKIFLFSYGSYCGCSFDLPGWQVVYDELKDKGVEFISVALDAGGAAAVASRIRAEDIPERDPVVRKLMGWTQEQWDAQRPPEYPCLIDSEHVVADLYNMTNVPMAVWIDEQGAIVRPTEAAGFSDSFRRMDHETFSMPDEDSAKLEANRALYVDALRDWAEHGAGSYAAMSPEQVRAKTRVPAEDDVRAAAHARLGKLCMDRGDNAGAELHFREATTLSPGKWNYRRQSMVLEPELVGELNVSPEFWQALDDLGEGYYYPPVELPGVLPR